MSKAVNIVFKWQINSSKFLYLVKTNFSYSNKNTWGFISDELNENDESAIKQNVLSLSEESYKNVFEYMRDEVLSKSDYSKYLTLFDYSCYYINNDCSWMSNQVTTPKIKTIVTTTTRTIGEGENADTTVNVSESDVLNEHTININFDFAIPKGKDGKDGERGADGEKGRDGTGGRDGNALTQKTVMIYHTCKRDRNGDIIKDSLGKIMPPDTPASNEGGWDKENNIVTAPSGWELYDSVEAPVFMSTKNFCGVSTIDDKEPWCAPIQITGADGVAGKDGESIQFVFCLTNDNLTDAVFVTEKEIGDGETVPIFRKGEKTYEFKDNATGVDSTHLTEYYTMRTKTGDKWTAWIKPVLWSKYGENGQDGDTVEYIYVKSKTELKNTSKYNPTPSGYDKDVSYQQKEYKPTKKVNGIAWTDNPSGVSEDYPYEYVSIRKYNDAKDDKGKPIGTKQWGKFSDPTLWAKFGKNGENGDVGQRGRILYPAGEWDENKIYKVDNNTAPYVTIKNNGKDEYYYLIQEGEGVQGKNPLNEIDPENPIFWRQMESFSAIYTELLVAKYGTIGGSVFYDDDAGNKYMFSTEGKINKETNGYKFTYNDETIEVSNAYRFFLFDKEKEGTMIDNNVNGEWMRKVSNGTYLEEIKKNSLFVPNVLINFSMGDGWFGCGTSVFKHDGSGYLSNGKINWTVDDDATTNKNESNFEINANLTVKNDDGEKVAEIGDIGSVTFIEKNEGTEDGNQITKKIILRCGEITKKEENEESEKSEDTKGESYIPFIRVNGSKSAIKVMNALMGNLGTTISSENDVLLCHENRLKDAIKEYNDARKTLFPTLGTNILDINGPFSQFKTEPEVLPQNTITVNHVHNILTKYQNKIKPINLMAYDKIEGNEEKYVYSLLECNRGSLFQITLEDDNITPQHEINKVTKLLYHAYKEKKETIKDETTGEDIVVMKPEDVFKGEIEGNAPVYIINRLKQIEDEEDRKNIRFEASKKTNVIPIVFTNSIDLTPILGLFDIDKNDIYIAVTPYNENEERQQFFDTKIEKKTVINDIFATQKIEIQEPSTLKISFKVSENSVYPQLFKNKHKEYFFSENSQISEDCKITVENENVNENTDENSETQKTDEKNTFGDELTDSKSQTIIYDDGTIETTNLICRDGLFSGSINANGTFTGQLSEANGTATNLNINSCTIEKDIFYNGNCRVRFEGNNTIENSSNETILIKDFYTEQQNRSKSGYTYDKTCVLFNDDITVGPNETLCIPEINVYGRRYTPRKKNNGGSFANLSLNITLKDNSEDEYIAYSEDVELTNHKGAKEIGYSVNYTGGYYDKSRRLSEKRNESYYYTNEDDHEKTLHLKIEARCVVWLECRQGCDYSNIIFKGEGITSTFNITSKKNKKDNEDNEEKTFSTADIVLAKEQPSFPMMRVLNDGIMFMTKAGNMVISANGIKTYDPNGTVKQTLL